MGKISRNAPCPCGSGKKYKKCCLEKNETGGRGANTAQRILQEDRVKSKPARDIQKLMKEGQDLAYKNKSTEACRPWGEAWEMLKEHKPADIRSLEALDSHFCSDGIIFNCLQDYEMELGNAGRDDPLYCEKRLTYCREFLDLLPESDPLARENMGRAIGEALFALGRVEEGDGVFEQLTRDFPESPWPYISWGDMYRAYGKSPADEEKAEKIYRAGLKGAVKEKDELLARLEEGAEK